MFGMRPSRRNDRSVTKVTGALRDFLNWDVTGAVNLSRSTNMRAVGWMQRELTDMASQKKAGPKARSKVKTVRLT